MTDSPLLEERRARVRAEWIAQCAKVRVGRKIPEWRGKTADSVPPGPVRDRVFETWERKCYLTSILIAGKPWDLEHVIPLTEGGLNHENNLRPALRAPHIRKTAEEKRLHAEADRQRRAANGTKAEPTKKIEGPKFKPTEPKNRASAPISKLAGLPRRPLYQEG